MSSQPSTVEVTVGDVTSPRELHERLAAALRFPDYYGHNWDAVSEVVAEEDVLPPRLVLRGWSDFQRALPRDAALLLVCMADYADAHPDRPCDTILT